MILSYPSPSENTSHTSCKFTENHISAQIATSLRRLLSLILVMTATLVAYADNNQLILTGRVKESLGKTDLTNAFVVRYDQKGEVIDSIQTNMGGRYVDGEVIPMSYFSFPVERKDSTYIFDIVCEGYTTRTITYDLENIGKRESYREIPVIFMQRAPRQLKEVTVTASKVKFYHKGDTVVFNADAFQLAEGSMLDALVSQLPGVELNDNGQIKINGKFVESLLLNGKEFLDGNNQLMLENIAAYTVKNIQVYDGQTEKEKWLDDPTGGKHLTMDVQLKREYNIGWMINAQGGYGTDDRYMGRVFASWFNPTTRVTLLGNVNNLNDTRKPGKSDTWTPDMMPSGTREYRMASLNYNYENPDETKRINGSVTFEQTSSNDYTTTARTNFFQNGDTYDNLFDHNRQRITKVETVHRGWVRNDNITAGGYLSGKYRKVDSNGASVSATFDTEQQEITMNAIEAIYTAGTPEQLDAIINRSITKSDGSNRQIDLRVCPTLGWRIPGTSDRLNIETYFRYDDSKEELWRDYTVNFGDNPTPTDRLRQYFDNSPNRLITSVNNITYYVRVNGWNLGVNYEYRFSNRDKDSYMYALDRLSDMGIYGTLPSGYLTAFDPSNSYTSHTIENTHSMQLTLIRRFSFSNKNSITIRLTPNFSLKHIHFDYWRDGRNQLVKRTNFLTSLGKYSAYLYADLGVSGEGRSTHVCHSLEYSITMDPKTPDPVDMVEAVNDSDPLNITEGNPGLKPQNVINQSIEWSFRPKMERHKLSNWLRLEYSITNNALTRGYIYNTSTGVRRIMTYNVDGNNSAGVSNTFRLQFGNSDQFTIASITDASISRYADMIGTDTAPVKYTAKNSVFGEKLDLSWQFSKQNITLRGSVNNRHTTSDRTDFSNINALHFSYGIIGQFNLPAGFGISTDFTMYSRRGYGVKELDTTDAIWNMRVSYKNPKLKQLVFMLDGFDMLHQLSNVNYAVNAAGRTVSYTNALPRYILFSVQYRLNIQPKKR